MLVGVRDFKLLDHWAARMPCSKYINTITGQPTVQGRPESVICVHGRWCPNCGYFYEVLTECANPHLVTRGVFDLVADTLCPSRRNAALRNEPLAGAHVRRPLHRLPLLEVMPLRLFCKTPWTDCLASCFAGPVQGLFC